MSRRYKGIDAVIRRGVARGAIIGFSARRMPMVEFECEKVMPCIHFLANPRAVYSREVAESCRYVNNLIWAFYEIQFYWLISKIPEKYMWFKAFFRKRNGEVAAPVVVAVGNKSVHVYGFVRLHLDDFERFVEMVRALECVDQRYLDMVLLKRQFTLRLSGKEQYGLRPVKPIFLGEVVEGNTNRWMLVGRFDRRAYMLFTFPWLFMRHGYDVVITAL